MAFNWAGAAAGMQDDLKEQIKLRLLQEESAQRQQQLTDNAEWRNMQAETNRINADAMGEARSASAEERRIKSEAAKQRQKWATETIGRGAPTMGPDDDEKQYNVALLDYYQAKHYAETGQELPGAVVQQLLTPRPVREDPNLLSPAALEQRLKIDREQERNKAMYGGERSATAKRQAAVQGANIAAQNYLTYVKRMAPNDLDRALDYISNGAGRDDLIRKSNGLVDMNQLRTMLINMYKPGMTSKQLMDLKTIELMKGGAGAPVVTGESDQ